tara:strand:+ start:1122 stop:2417 length:1296 start_codon:yes stop_codon:yes gene_type:complete
MKKIRYLHLSDNFYPLITGGTEIFIQKFINEQIKLKNHYEISWVCHKSNDYKFKKINNLEKYKIFLEPVLYEDRLNRFSFKAKAIPAFDKFLYDFKPDIVHIHSLGSRTTLNHIKSIKRFGSKILFTLHTPPCSCMGNLLNASHEICNGDLIDSRCTYFRLRSKGIPYIIAKIISLQDGFFISPNMNNRLSRLLTSRKLTSSMHLSWLQLINEVDYIHVLSKWGKDMLIRQKIDSDKIHLIRTAGPNKISSKKRLPIQDNSLKLVFWGRCNPQKGIHIVINALAMIEKDLPISLDIYGPYWEDNQYSKDLMKKIKLDPRIRVLGNLPNDQLLKKLQNYDLAVIPSIWMETGPLSLLEAFAAGIPVAGTNLGGIKELLINQKGCFILPPNEIVWKETFIKIMKNKTLIGNFNSPSLRTFEDLVNDIMEILFD